MRRDHGASQVDLGPGAPIPVLASAGALRPSLPLCGYKGGGIGGCNAN